VTPRVLGLLRGRADDDARSNALEPLLTATEVARILSVRPKRVYELGIPAVKLSERSLRWRPSQVAAWLQQREGDR
jgi:predicted DNA-binding transcriptional regulator AlpA